MFHWHSGNWISGGLLMLFTTLPSPLRIDNKTSRYFVLFSFIWLVILTFSFKMPLLNSPLMASFCGVCVCVCRLSGTLSWRMWTDVCRQQTARRLNTWALRPSSAMDGLESESTRARAVSGSVQDGAFKPLLCFLTCRSVTLGDYMDEGQKLLLVLIRHFGWILWRDHVTELQASQVCDS